MNPLETQFHRAQSRIKTAEQAVLRGRQHEAPTFSADVLCAVDPDSPEDRLIAYAQKRRGMKLPTITEAVSSVRVKRLVPVRVKERAA